MTGKTTTIQWPTLTTADLAAAHTLPQVDTALAEDIAAHGILEPLFIATTATGAPRVADGMRRLAAAVALNLADVPVTYRPVIHVTALTAHPGNVRRDLKVSPEFLKSIKVSGIRTAIQVTRAPDGQLTVVDGHRRLAAAIKLQLTHVPYTYEDLGAADQVLDMVTTARHRAGLTKSEEMAALFDAAELGADARRIAAAAALPVTEARQIKKLSGSGAARAVAATTAHFTLTEYLLLAELEQLDPQAAKTITTEAAAEPLRTFEWRIRAALNGVENAKQLAAHRADLEAQGVPVRSLEELADTAKPVRELPITAEEHQTCQGHVWAPADSCSYEPYCTSPALYGHAPEEPAETVSATPTASERRAIISGNEEWETAETIRREWLANFLGRGRRPKGETDLLMTLTARVLMSGATIIKRHASHPKATGRLNEWFGVKEFSGGAQRAAAVTPAKAAAQAFATVATAYEQHAIRTVWRTDRQHAEAEVRATTAEYLGWLTELGYKPSPIEQAVIDGQPYNPSACALARDEASGKTI